MRDTSVPMNEQSIEGIEVATSPDPKNTRRFELIVTEMKTDDSVWTNEQIANLEKESIDYWDKIEEKERRGMAMIMRDCLIRLVENPGEWLPTAVTPLKGSRLGVFMFFSIDEVEETIMAMREEAEIELRNQMFAIAGMRDDLLADDSDVEDEGKNTADLDAILRDENPS